MEPPSKDAGASPAVARRLRGIRVLVVDDNADVRELITAVLEAAEADVATAESADRALEAVRLRRPDVLLCDLHMPGVDGFEFIHRLRSWERATGSGHAIPAAAVSAYAALGRRLRHARDEFEAFVTKPVDPDTLVRIVLQLAHGQTHG